MSRFRGSEKRFGDNTSVYHGHQCRYYGRRRFCGLQVADAAGGNPAIWPVFHVEAGTRNTALRDYLAAEFGERNGSYITEKDCLNQ
jgi:hypothetical protein